MKAGQRGLGRSGGWWKKGGQTLRCSIVASRYSQSRSPSLPLSLPLSLPSTSTLALYHVALETCSGLPSLSSTMAIVVTLAFAPPAKRSLAAMLSSFTNKPCSSSCCVVVAPTIGVYAGVFNLDQNHRLRRSTIFGGKLNYALSPS